MEDDLFPASLLKWEKPMKKTPYTTLGKSKSNLGMADATS